MKTMIIGLFLIWVAVVHGQTVPSLNVTQYLGRWYQVYADLLVDGTFERDSFCDTADYGVNTNGTVSVVNRERLYSPTGTEQIIDGWAQITDPSQPGQITVHLQGTMFAAPYWVYQLGPLVDGLYDYSIVSDPLKLTLFVLARNVTRFMANYDEKVLQFLEGEGFTGILDGAIPTQQEGCVYW